MSPEYRKQLNVYLEFDYEKSDIFSLGTVILDLN